TEQHAEPLANGAALSFAAHVPDNHCFNSRGGRVLPLFRDRDSTEPNCAHSLLDKLGKYLGLTIDAEDMLAYIAAVVSHSGYTARFREELKVPGIRVPITLDTTMWCEAVKLGREVVSLHTYGERMGTHTNGRRPTPLVEVSADEGSMPNTIRYDEDTETIVIGEDTLFERAGRIGPVRAEVWNYTVGGMPVVRKWFSYRQQDPKYRKRTSSLDDINPTRWTARFDDELLDLLEVLDGCVALEPPQADLLDRILVGPIVTVADLEREGVFPVPLSARKPPRHDPMLL
ncbi:MAG TPA: type ISP restriction/modification enzyme, partial [Umezawaea sp.]|nr:type ISP restriction/modification enzyme [Umezawaea sp.]